MLEAWGRASTSFGGAELHLRTFDVCFDSSKTRSMKRRSARYRRGGEGRWGRRCFLMVICAVLSMGISPLRAAEWPSKHDETPLPASPANFWQSLAATPGQCLGLSDRDLAGRSARGFQAIEPNYGDLLVNSASIVLWDELGKQGGSGKGGTSLSNGGVTSIAVPAIH